MSPQNRIIAGDIAPLPNISNQPANSDKTVAEVIAAYSRRRRSEIVNDSSRLRKPTHAIRRLGPCILNPRSYFG